MNPEIFKVTQKEIEELNKEADYKYTRADYVIKGIKKKSSVYVKRFLELGLDPTSNSILTVQSALNYPDYSIHINGLPIYQNKTIDANSIRYIIEAFDLERVFTRPLERIYPYKLIEPGVKYSLRTKNTDWIERQIDSGYIRVYTLFDFSTKGFSKVILDAQNKELFFLTETGGRIEIEDTILNCQIVKVEILNTK